MMQEQLNELLVDNKEEIALFIGFLAFILLTNREKK